MKSECTKCGSEEVRARGLCKSCYDKYILPLLDRIQCKVCKKYKIHHAHKCCKSCYDKILRKKKKAERGDEPKYNKQEVWIAKKIHDERHNVFRKSAVLDKYYNN